jgi:hypothetical protein
MGAATFHFPDDDRRTTSRADFRKNIDHGTCRFFRLPPVLAASIPNADVHLFRKIYRPRCTAGSLHIQHISYSLARRWARAEFRQIGRLDLLISLTQAPGFLPNPCGLSGTAPGHHRIIVALAAPESANYYSLLTTGLALALLPHPMMFRTVTLKLPGALEVSLISNCRNPTTLTAGGAMIGVSIIGNVAIDVLIVTSCPDNERGQR